MDTNTVNAEALRCYQKAQTHKAAGRIKQARVWYWRAAREAPHQAELWCRLGELSLDGHDYQAFDQAVNIAPATAQDWYWRARAAVHYHRDIDTVSCVQKALAPASSPAEWLSDAAEWLTKQVRETEYEFIEQTAPASSPPSWYRLKVRWSPDWMRDSTCCAASILPFWELLHATYSLLIEQEPGNAAAYRWRAKFYERHDHLPQAITDYTAALKLEPNVEDFECRGQLYVLRQDFRRAQRDFLKLVTDGEFYQSHWRRDPEVIVFANPQLLPGDDRWLEALAAYEKLGLPESTNRHYLAKRCEYFQTTLQYERATADAQTLVKRYPRDVDYRNALILSRVYNHRNRDYQALTADYLALATEPRNSPWIRARGYHHAAWAYFRLGDYKEARQQFDKAVSISQPKETEYRDYKLFMPTLFQQHDYLVWQLQQQLRTNFSSYNTHYEAHIWMMAACGHLRQYHGWHLLQIAFSAYLPVKLPAGYYFVNDKSAEDYEAVFRLCEEGLQCPLAPADLFGLIHLNALKGQLRHALNQPGATAESEAAALAHYDDARAKALYIYELV
jgi:tetratricopeptide (TPR) repeat protein